MNIHRIKLLLQYALALASENEEPSFRTLGPIHLVKYVYLADLGYAKAHGGETYTGIPWKFHHFGPWNTEVFRQIEPALVPIGASKISIQSRFTDDFNRWSLRSENVVEGIESQIDFIAALAVKDAVRKFGSDTEGLLHFVYNTKPMLKAAPEEILDFAQELEVSAKREVSAPDAPLSKGQVKRLEAKKQRIKDELERRYLKKQEIKKKSSGAISTQYDQSFFEGVAWLDSLAGSEISEEKMTCSIAPEMWKSKARYDPDIS